MRNRSVMSQATLGVAAFLALAAWAQNQPPALEWRPRASPPESLTPPGVPQPTAAEHATINEVLELERAMEAAVVRQDTGFLERVLAPSFIFTHGDGWVDGGAPLKVDTKSSWLAYVKQQAPPYWYRELDHVQVELHGDVAITLGRYFYLPRSPNQTRANHMQVWFERVYAKRDGRWQHLSHRTIKGPLPNADAPPNG